MVFVVLFAIKLLSGSKIKSAPPLFVPRDGRTHPNSISNKCVKLPIYKSAIAAITGSLFTKWLLPFTRLSSVQLCTIPSLSSSVSLNRIPNHKTCSKSLLNNLLSTYVYVCIRRKFVTCHYCLSSKQETALIDSNPVRFSQHLDWRGKHNLICFIWCAR